ncbi:hypothetical protein Daura_48835 [Dactylosporangium aurantiacum]|uniref:Uncharacterized protein n=1 Tax=Dactylosporangium aurantiacum TaxID=35754 RepID=A0A9Q9IDE6_9ACTN|nr:hypothetical protein [Dactylosporangium aurantiacum]MDG6107492.1 hypothetical protein [Dactylosporangium aurantiacum]UWZ54284.1 hypothetical protein Daura_48835 [Dactylosporangium aurantiacum]
MSMPLQQQYQTAQLTPCRFCNNVPTAQTKFRGHRGMIIMMQFRHVDGPFCRDCGMATFREMTSKTLIQGWYGYASFVITPFIVLWNIINRGKVASLAPPQPSPYGGARQPMNPGKRLLARPISIIGLCVPFILIFGLILVIALSGDA